MDILGILVPDPHEKLCGSETLPLVRIRVGLFFPESGSRKNRPKIVSTSTQKYVYSVFNTLNTELSFSLLSFFGQVPPKPNQRTSLRPR